MQLSCHTHHAHAPCGCSSISGCCQQLLCTFERRHGHAGRATVELTIEKQDGSLAYVTNEGGGPQKEVRRA
jgi:hypothetical protein